MPFCSSISLTIRSGEEEKFFGDQERERERETPLNPSPAASSSISRFKSSGEDFSFALISFALRSCLLAYDKTAFKAPKKPSFLEVFNNKK